MTDSLTGRDPALVLVRELQLPGADRRPPRIWEEIDGLSDVNTADPASREMRGVLEAAAKWWPGGTVIPMRRATIPTAIPSAPGFRVRRGEVLDHRRVWTGSARVASWPAADREMEALLRQELAHLDEADGLPPSVKQHFYLYLPDLAEARPTSALANPELRNFQIYRHRPAGQRRPVDDVDPQITELVAGRRDGVFYVRAEPRVKVPQREPRPFQPLGSGDGRSPQPPRT